MCFMYTYDTNIEVLKKMAIAIIYMHTLSVFSQKRSPDVCIYIGNLEYLDQFAPRCRLVRMSAGQYLYIYVVK